MLLSKYGVIGAAGTGVVSTNLEQRLGIDTAAVAVNVKATLSGGVYTVDWGDGTSSIDVASGVSATHTYAAPFAGDVVIHYPVGITLNQLSSTAGAWAFDLSDLASSVTNLTFSNTPSVITGSISTNSTLTYLHLGNTPSVITGDIDANSMLTYLHLGNNTSGVITGSISTNSTLTYLNLGNTSSVIIGDIGDNSMLTSLYLNDTSSVITGAFGDNSTLAALQLANTSSAITGALGDNSTMAVLQLASTSSTITGDIGVNSKLTYLHLGNTSSTITGGTPFNTSGSAQVFNFADITPGYSTATVDAIINSLGAETTWSGLKLIDLSGTHAPRSSASDAAVSTLTGLGVTVTTTP